MSNSGFTWRDVRGCRLRPRDQVVRGGVGEVLERSAKGERQRSDLEAVSRYGCGGHPQGVPANRRIVITLRSDEHFNE